MNYLKWHAREFPSSNQRVAQIVKQYLLPFFGDLRLNEIKKQSVERYKSARTAAPATIAKELRTLQAMMNKAADWDMIAKNPIKGVKPPKDMDDSPPRYLTDGEMRELCAVSGFHAPWWRLMSHTGMRRAEALALRWEHVHDDVLVIVSSSGSRTKAGRSRAVPLSQTAKAALEQCPESANQSQSPSEQFVLPRMNPNSLSRIYRKDAAKAGLQSHIHDLRHTFCSQLVLRGVHPRKVQQLAGHSSINVTERYTRLLTSDLAADVRMLD